MPKYSNGYVPRNILIKIASGTDVNGYWEHLITPATLYKWNIALAYARRKWGKVMRISTGWNCYRPIAIQADARGRAEANGEPNSAALPGWSSHGGTWVSWKHTGGRWVDAMAIDVVPQALTWAQVDEAMRHAGFLVGAITKAIAGIDEPWHYIDLDPWAAVPAGDTGSAANLDKETEVKTYRKQDATARAGGRTVKPNAAFWLNTTKGASASKATNLVGGIGAYSISPHIYATGTPGDVLEVVLAWDDTKTVAPHSMHYTERITVDKDGFIRANREFKRDVKAGEAVYARLRASKTNKGPITVTVFDADAYLFLA